MTRMNEKKNVMLAIGIVLLALTAAITTPAPSAARTDADLRAGMYTDMSAITLGGGLLSSMSSGWFFNPNVEAAFGDTRDMFTINGDFHYDFPTDSPVSPYLGAGPAILYRNPDRGDSSTDLGLNFIGGVAGLRGQVRPFAQVKAIMSSNSEVALMGGIRF
jgi:hypothetical protein